MYIAIEDIVHLMNVQNIPSHATDIRHMFRATAAQHVLEDCSYNEDADIVTIDISKFNKIQLQDGQYISVENLRVGDSVKLLEDGKEVYRIVKEISVANNDTCLCHVVF